MMKAIASMIAVLATAAIFADNRKDTSVPLVGKITHTQVKITKNGDIVLCGGGKVPYTSLSCNVKGVFVFTVAEESYYRWHDVRPDSLPTVMKEAHREYIIALLKRADGLYAAEEFQRACRCVRAAKGHSAYLTAADMKERWYLDIETKAKGHVLYGGKRMTVDEAMAAKGRVKYKGVWLTPDKAEAKKQRAEKRKNEEPKKEKKENDSSWYVALKVAPPPKLKRINYFGILDADGGASLRRIKKPKKKSEEKKK